MRDPLVSFLVVNWNGEEFLEECLNSIAGQSYKNFEIIVVDNASTDHSRSLLQHRKDIQFILNDSNLGFGKANNQALTVGKGEFVAFINNDVVLDPHWLERMLDPLLHRKEAGMCAGKTLSYQQRDVIDNTGHLLYWDGLNRGRGRMQKDCGQFDSIHDALLPSGCASFHRVEMLQQIGYFDEEFYLYGDDTELGMRARLAGWECAFAPTAIAYHCYSASTAPYHPPKFFYVERNRLWVALKYFPVELLLLNPLFSFVRYVFHFIALIGHKGVSGEFAKNEPWWKLFALWFRAQISGWGAAPHFLRKRKSLNRKRFYQCFLPNRIGVKEIAFIP